MPTKLATCRHLFCVLKSHIFKLASSLAEHNMLSPLYILNTALHTPSLCPSNNCDNVNVFMSQIPKIYPMIKRNQNCKYSSVIMTNFYANCLLWINDKYYLINPFLLIKASAMVTYNGSGEIKEIIARNLYLQRNCWKIKWRYYQDIWLTMGIHCTFAIQKINQL